MAKSVSIFEKHGPCPVCQGKKDHQADCRLDALAAKTAREWQVQSFYVEELLRTVCAGKYAEPSVRDYQVLAGAMQIMLLKGDAL